MKSSQRPAEFEQDNCDVTSILGYVIEKNSSRGAESSRYSLSAIGWKDKDVMPDDRMALEKHVYVATRAVQISKHWILTLNKKRPQQPLNQRPDFAQAKRECKRLHDEHLARTQQDYRDIPRSQQVRQRKKQQLEGIEEFDCAVGPKTGLQRVAGKPADSFVIVVKLGSKPTGRRAISILSILQGLTICEKKKNCLRVRTSFGCLEKNLQPTDGGGSGEQCTHKYSTYRVAQHDHISSREYARLKSWKAQECTSLCPKAIVIHVFRSFIAALDTDDKDKFSHLPHRSFQRSLQHAQDLWYTMNIYPAMFHGRVADQHKYHLSKKKEQSCPIRSCRICELSLSALWSRICRFARDRGARQAFCRSR